MRQGSQKKSLDDYFPYMVTSLFPLALLDMRLPGLPVVVRVSDFYLLILFPIFLLFIKGSMNWTLKTIGPFVPFLAYLCAYTVFTGDTNSVVEAIQWMMVLLWVPLFSFALNSGDKNLIKFILYCLFLVTTYVAIWHYANGLTYSFKHMGDAKYAFGLFALLSCLSLFRFNFIIGVIFVVSAIVMLILSNERTGTLASVVALVLFRPLIGLIRGYQVNLILMFVQLVFLCSGFIAFYLGISGDFIVTHYVDEELARWESDLHRSNLIANGVDIFLNHPIFGVGARNLEFAMEDYYVNSILALYTHNFYLDFFIEYGIVGVLLFFLPVFYKIVSMTTFHPLSWAVLPLAFYCMTVPVFMANGTTTMLIYFSAVACLAATNYRVPVARPDVDARLPRVT